MLWNLVQWDTQISFLFLDAQVATHRLWIEHGEKVVEAGVSPHLGWVISLLTCFQFSSFPSRLREGKQYFVMGMQHVEPHGLSCNLHHFILCFQKCLSASVCSDVCSYVCMCIVVSMHNEAKGHLDVCPCQSEFKINLSCPVSSSLSLNLESWFLRIPLIEQ